MSDREEFSDLDNFEKKEQIGKGGFSEVFKVAEKKTGKIYAAKICKKKLDRNTKEIKELRVNLSREVNIISGLDHPAVLKFYGYSKVDFEQESKPVIITEYSSNGTLRNITEQVRQQKVPQSWDDTKKLINIYGIASGVSYLHSRDILHRDLKPQNILEDDNLFPQIADFGLALISHQKQDANSYQPNNKALGTPIYAAPEIWKKNAYSTKGDVYSFGYIVYEIMTNEAPFQGFTQDQVFDEVIANRIRPEFKCPIPDVYKQLIEKCWADDPNERPNFSTIVKELKTNPDFITEKVNKTEFRDYVKYIDQFHTTFDANKPIISYEEIKNSHLITPLNEIQTIQKRIKIIKPKRSSKKVHRKHTKQTVPQKNSLNDREDIQPLKKLNMPPNNASLLYRNTSIHLLPLVA